MPGRRAAWTALMPVDTSSAVPSSDPASDYSNFRQTDLHNKLKFCVSIWSHQFVN